ncbi:calcyclin-binding protein [Toxorhynchites rutilus septentrionalis]|uniref:calcyclin-binding protein n=1 Tax=Toxorhynchites rutilus septentrionalis TaxID=329112 RepID=UPI002479F77A|nr:calcyclin-binding protein [Toxorhynchites rutilus septentrionalis]
MSQKNIDNLSLDLEELKRLADMAQRAHVQQLLSIDIRKIETDIQFQKDQLKEKEHSSETPKPPASLPGDCKRYRVELKEYAWDQSDKFIKIFVTINDVQQLPEENVNVEFTSNSFNLLIGNLNNKDYVFVVKNLLNEIDTVKSYRKVKSDMVAIYLAKVKPTKWAHLTVTAKRLQDMKEDRMSGEKSDATDPSAGLMKMMQQLYDSGDAETKRMINKAWHESQNKKSELEGATNLN